MDKDALNLWQLVQYPNGSTRWPEGHAKISVPGCPATSGQMVSWPVSEIRLLSPSARATRAAKSSPASTAKQKYGDSMPRPSRAGGDRSLRFSADSQAYWRLATRAAKPPMQAVRGPAERGFGRQTWPGFPTRQSRKAAASSLASSAAIWAVARINRGS